jgi:hypothetical protein
MSIREDLTQAIRGLSESKINDLDENVENVVELLDSKLRVIELAVEALLKHTTDSEIENYLHELYMSI